LTGVYLWYIIDLRDVKVLSSVTWDVKKVPDGRF